METIRFRIKHSVCICAEHVIILLLVYGKMIHFFKEYCLIMNNCLQPSVVFPLRWKYTDYVFISLSVFACVQKHFRISVVIENT